MDRIDRRILDLLQHDAEMEVAEVAERVGLSKAPCWRRIHRLKEQGFIRKTVVLLDPKRLNLSATVFVTVKTADHSAEWFERFSRVLSEIHEVTDIYRMSGDVDYLLRLVLSDIDAYGSVYSRLIAACQFLDISASFALETIKQTTALPLNHLGYR